MLDDPKYTHTLMQPYKYILAGLLIYWLASLHVQYTFLSYSVPYRMKIYNEFSLLNWFRMVNLTKLSISKILFLSN